MALPSLPLLTSPNYTNLFHTATCLHLYQSPTGTRPVGLGAAQPSNFWGRGLPQITYGGGPFQSPTPPKNTYGEGRFPIPYPTTTVAQKYIRRRVPSHTFPLYQSSRQQSPTHNPPKYIRRAFPIPTPHRPFVRRHDIIKKHRSILYIQNCGCFLIISTRYY